MITKNVENIKVEVVFPVEHDEKNEIFVKE